MRRRPRRTILPGRLTASPLQANLLELHHHPVASVELKADKSALEPLGDLVIDHLRGDLAIDRKPQSLSLRVDMHLIPLALLHITHFHRTGEGHSHHLAVLPNCDPLPSPGEIVAPVVLMKIPRPQNLVANSNVTDVRVVSVQATRFSLHRSTPNLQPGVAFRQQAIAEFHLKIAELILEHEVGLPPTAGSHDLAIPHFPIPGLTLGSTLPTGERLPIKDRFESVLRKEGSSETHHENRDKMG